MKSLMLGTFLLTSISFLALANDDRPPADALKLSEVVQKLEQQGFYPIVDIEFDDGVWEIDAYRGADKRELQVDPRTGKVLRDRDD